MDILVNILASVKAGEICIILSAYRNSANLVKNIAGYPHVHLCKKTKAEMKLE